jgi:hypothetical protein
MIDPPSLSQSALAQALRITGKNFSGEAIVVLQGQDGKQVPLTINQRSDTSLTAIVPPNLGANGYQVLVANAGDELPVSSGSLAVRPVVEGPKFGVLVVEKGSLAITASTAGTVTLLGQTAQLPQGVTLPVNDVNVGDVVVQMTYADGTMESQTVRVAAGQTATVLFQEKTTIEKTNYVSQSDSFDTWSTDWKLPRPGQGVLLFQAQIGGHLGYSTYGLQVAFSNAPRRTESMYVISTAGASGNYNPDLGTALRKGGAILARVGQGARQDVDNYWILFDKANHRISFGFGTNPEKNVVVKYEDKNFVGGAQYFSLANHMGQDVRFSNIRVLDWPTPESK